MSRFFVSVRVHAAVFMAMFCLCLPMSGEAAEKSGAGDLSVLLGQVEAGYARAQSLECAFKQKSRSGGQLREAQGRAYFVRPGDAGASVIRWEYLRPDLQTIVNDGQEIQMYTPADKQLLVTPAAALDADLAYALFTGKSSLKENFTVAAADAEFQLSPAPAGARAMLLTPKTPQSQLKRAQVWINKDQRIERILMEDYFEALTELSFTDMKFGTIKPGDAARREKLRHIETSPGTEIIRQ